MTIANCLVDGARGLGVYLDTGSHHNTVIKGGAIAIDGSYSNTIIGNTLSGNAYGGIVVSMPG